MDISSFLRTLAMDRTAIFALTLLLIGLVSLLIFAPRAGAVISGRVGENTLLGRMLAQLRLLTRSDRPFAERVTRLAYRDGRPSGELDTGSDFLLFTRVAAGAISTALGLLLAILTGFPLLVLIAPAGFALPAVYAIYYNRERLKKMNVEVPPILRQLETRVSAGLDLRESFVRISAGRPTGLYAELGWAAAQMANPSLSRYEILRSLDARTGLHLWAPLADQMERAIRRGRRDETDVFLAYIGRLITDDEAKRDAMIAGIGNKVIVAMFPFLFGGLLASVIGPLIFNLSI
jgi:hypothetical protein